MKKIILQTQFVCLLFTGLFSAYTANAQCVVQGAYEGTDFWTAFMPNFGSSTLQLALTSRCAATATVTTPAATGAGTLNQVIAIPANTIQTISVAASYGTPAVTMQSAVINTPVKNGIHVVSDQPISVYGMNQATASLDSWVTIAANKLDKDYISVAFTGASNPSFSQVLVLATESGTTTINYTVPAGKTVSGQGSSFTAMLTQGQTYLIRPPGGAADQYELTGIQISADKKIAVLGGVDGGIYPEVGNRATNDPAGVTTCGPLDHFVEMLAPTLSWGGTYVVPRWKFQGADASASGNVTTKGSYIRIVSAESGTVTVSITGQTPLVLTSVGDYEDRIITADALITSSGKKIAVYEIMAGTVCYSAVPATGLGDGDYMTIAPAEQWGKQYTFATPPGGSGRNHYISIVKRGKTANDGGIKLDGTAQTAFTQVGTTDYWVKSGISVSAATHSLTGDSIYIVYSYGIETAGSYSNPVSGSTLLPVLLPVEFVSFIAKYENKQIALTWVTNQEKNAKEFVIERMGRDGKFESIASIPASGGANLRTYTSHDTKPLEGPNYYRIKQVDFDQNYSYSSIAVANTPIIDNRLLSASWVENELQISMSSADAGLHTLYLYDMQGRCITNQEINIANAGSNSISLNTNDINPGVYFLQLSSQNSAVQQIKVVK